MRYDRARVEQLLQVHKTKEVINELVQLNEGLLYKQLKRFRLLDDPDAISFGYEALYNAIVTYDISRRKFSTYATVCIYNTLGSHVRSLKSLINTSVESYHTPLNAEGITLLDYLESNDTADGSVLMDCEFNDLNSAMRICISELDGNIQRDIVREWLASECTIKQATLAARYGCTQTYVSHVIAKFRASLKRKLEALENG